VRQTKGQAARRTIGAKPMVNPLRYAKAIAGTGKRTVLVVGDVMVDEYIWGKVTRMSPEAPVPVVEARSESYGLGGACNVVENLRALGAKVFVAGVIGADATGDRLLADLAHESVDIGGIVRDPLRPTTLKTRVMAQSQQVVRIDRESRQPVTADCVRQICAYIESVASRVDAIVISDYAKGVAVPELCAFVIDIGRRMGKPVLVDPKGADFRKYRGATMITPNRSEAEMATGMKIKDEATLDAVGERLLDLVGCDSVVVTLDAEGMRVFEAEGAITHVPALEVEVFDVTGAGDTVVSALAAGLSCGLTFVDAGVLSTFAASVTVRKIGVAAVSPREIEAAMNEGYELVPEVRRGAIVAASATPGA
jgi:D-beta-D-heptose 7-phosphate kinase / D-beta-D-heptose 1-phosphate adenosyltransferase